MYFFLIFFLLFSRLYADGLTIDPPTIWDTDCYDTLPPQPPLLSSSLEDCVIVDLKNPLYEEGVLSTHEGGVLTAPGIRIQAQKIHYVRDLESTPPIHTVSCEGNLWIDYQQWTLVGDSLHYDFIAQEGSLIEGRIAEPPWYIGGEKMSLHQDRSLTLLNGFITTSEGEFKDVVLKTPQVSLSQNRVLIAKQVTIRVNGLPIFWLPKLQIDLKAIRRTPFAIRYGWRGFTGSYVSLLYHFLSWRELQATARIDAFLGKGFGGGIETAYDPDFRPTQFYTRNYYAHDIPLDDPIRKDRYRFQGTFYDKIYGMSIDAMYDIVSDGQMAADYQTKDFDLKTAGKTELRIRRKTPSWLANFYTKVRVNSFQSINQELPTLQMNLHPFEIPHTGFLFENTIRASYLNYVFSSDLFYPKQNFSSARLATHPFLYRPSRIGPFTISPEVGLIGIAYSNSPSGHSVGQALGELGLSLKTSLYSPIWKWKHVVEPYLHYHFLTSPRVGTDHHFIFNIHDGWSRLNQLRFGLRNSLFAYPPSQILRPLWIEIWANAFFNTPTIKTIIPRGYLNVEWQPHPRLLASINTAWLFQHQQLDFLKTRIDWTISKQTALRLEFRHRSRYDWRKADFYNFILESVRTETALLNSPLSNARETILVRLFTRINPELSFAFDLRQGWNRKQRSYLEYQIEMARIIFQHWKLTLNFEKRESDNRFSFSLFLHE